MKRVGWIGASSVALLLGLLEIVGCSGSESAATDDACTHMYEAGSARADACGFQPYGDRDRYLQACRAQMLLTGVGMTAESIDACKAVLDAYDCTVEENEIPECQTIAGALTEGESCSSDLQCDSLSCTGVVAEKSGVLTCGSCASIKSTKKAKILSEGAACEQGSKTARCNSKTFCESKTLTCVKRVGEGEGCALTRDCTPGFNCIDLVCTKAKAGGSKCSNTDDCEAGLACDHETEKCAPRSYTVEPGDTCDADTRACRRGVCNLDTLSPKSTELKGVCPTVLADGDRCDDADPSTLCDWYATCENNKCKLRTSLACDDAAE